MPAEARVTRIWKNQRIFLVVLLLGFAAAFAFDGFVRYPRLNHQYNTHKEYMEKDDREGWEAHANREKWNTTPPEKHYSESEQFVFAGLMGILGLYTLFYWLSHKGRVLRTDANGVHTPGGKIVPFSAITGLGKKKWESKGLATVRYEINGQRGQFIVDDYKFDPHPTRQILEEIEQNLIARSKSSGSQ